MLAQARALVLVPALVSVLVRVRVRAGFLVLGGGTDLRHVHVQQLRVGLA